MERTGGKKSSKRQARWRSEARSSRQLRGVLASLGKRLRALRLERNLTQEAVAAGAMIDPKHYQAIEAGRVNITLASLVGISVALKMKLAALFNGI